MEQERGVVESAGFFEIWQELHFHAMEKFSADSDEVSVRDFTNVVQFLSSALRWQSISLLSEVLHQILCRIRGSHW